MKILYLVLVLGIIKTDITASAKNTTKKPCMTKSNSSSYLEQYFLEQQGKTMSEIASAILSRSSHYARQQEEVMKRNNSLRRTSSSSQ